MDTIEERVKRVIAEQLGVSQFDVKPEASFGDDLGADSLDEIELVMAIEDEFEMEISDNDAEKIKTVKQAIEFVIGKVPA